MQTSNWPDGKDRNSGIKNLKERLGKFYKKPIEQIFVEGTEEALRVR